MNKYKATKGAMFNDEQAQVIGERVEELAEENNGYITPELVVIDAKFKKSPLHNHFEWDDGIAAAQFRIRQARQIMSHIDIIIKTNGDEEPVKAFHNVIIINEKDNTSERVYSPLINVMSDKEQYRQIVEKAMKELDGWRKRYKQYQELGKIFAVIDEVKEHTVVLS